MPDFTTILEANCRTARTKRKMQDDTEIEFLDLIRKAHRYVKDGKETVVVVKKRLGNEVIFGDYSKVMSIYVRKGLLQIKTYDSLQIEDLEKEVVEMI